MKIPFELHQKIVNFLSSIPNMHEPDTQRSLIYYAGLDSVLQKLISFGGNSAKFAELLVSTLVQHEPLVDSGYSLQAILVTAKDFIGQDKREHCDTLIDELQIFRNSGEEQQDFFIGQHQLNQLLDVLKSRITPSELRELIYRVLGPNEESNLSGETYIEKVLSFLERVQEVEKEKSLLTILSQMRPDIDLGAFKIISVAEEKLPEPEPTEFIQFVNRKVEWEKVVLYPKGQYYLFDGPAGCGKTALLRKIKKEFSRRNWDCIYISLQEHQTFPEIAAYIGQKFQIKFPIYYDNPRQTGLEVGKAFAEKYKKRGVEGIAFLLDDEHEPWDDLISTLRTIFEEVIPGIFNALTHNSNYFKRTQWSFRVVLAGRYIASEVSKFDTAPKFDITRLTPFDYNVALDICQEYAIEDIQERQEFAAHLFFYSGGHPRCMVKMLNLYQQSGILPADFFNSYRDKIEAIAYEEANWVRYSIARDWRIVFDELCIYRFFDYQLLGQLLDEHSDWAYMAEDGFALAIKLKYSYSVVWVDDKRRYLHDDITRRLLSIQLRHDTPEALFRSKCEHARDICLTRLQQSDYERSLWGIEALFQYLQAHVCQIHKPNVRKALRQHFMEQELPEALNILVNDRDPRPEKDSLIGILETDLEFQFTLNYFLREEIYDDNPYQQMLTRIDQFFSNLSQDSGGK